MTASEILVLRHADSVFALPSWELASPSLDTLGWVARTGGRSFVAPQATYEVTDVTGAVTWTLRQSSTPALSRFEVHSPFAGLLGRIEQENALFAPALTLTDLEDNSVRVVAAARGSWTVQDLAGQPLGRVTAEASAGRLGGRTFTVIRGEGLGGTFWSLSLLATVCLDVIHLRRQRGHLA
jgi:hypothetical protein